jgi:predicted DNA-binding transcriptional regulator AlpA
MHDHQTYLPASQVRIRYGVSDMSLWRWLRDEALGFPHPIRINGRRFWRLADLEAFEASCSKKQEAPHAIAAA